MGFQKVEEVLSHVGGKVLVFGKQGTGKSTFVGTFPNINLVDTEDGQTYYLGKNKNIKADKELLRLIKIRLDKKPEQLKPVTHSWEV